MAIIIGTKDNFKTEVLEAKGTVIVDFLLLGVVLVRPYFQF